jgi:hypothetical protein
MQISGDTQRVIQFIDDTFPDSLKRKEDFSAILELGASFGLYSQVNELIFIAASIEYMRKKLVSTSVNDTSTEKMKNEFQNSVREMASLINQLGSTAAENEIELNFDHYLDSSSKAIENLIALSSDLSLLKEVQNKMKER